MAKLKSTAVKVYPSAFRGLATGTKYNPEARLNTEFNVTNLTNRLSSKDSFVIKWDSSDPLKRVITFNIHGYYFELNLTEFLSTGAGSTWTNIYARIRLLPFLNDEGEPSAPNTKYKAITLAGTSDVGTIPSPGIILDVTTSSIDTFFGIDLNDSATVSLASTDYELHLLSGGPSAWAVPLTSRLKFVATDVEGLPTINNSTTLKTDNTIFAPTTAGTSNQVLISAGGTNAPVWSGATIGSTTQPIYLNGGVITAINTTIGSGTRPVFLSSGTITQSSSTVGSTSKPIFMSSGTITELSANVGSTSQPVYLNGGTITAITGSIANNTTGSAATLTTPRLFTVTDNDATNSQAAATSFNGSAAYTVRLPATIKANLTGNVTGNVTGDVSGNAGTVTNGVYTTGNQTIGGTKTFSNTISGSINGNAATVTANNYSFVFGNVYSPLFIQNGPGNRTPMIDSRFEYDLSDGTLYAPIFVGSFSGSLTNSVTFNNSGSGVASGTSYNGGTARTISYNTLGAAASSHTHGNITNAGAIGDVADRVVTTTTSGVLTTSGRSGIDSRTTFPPESHNHDDRYYTETETNTFLNGKANTSHTHAATDVTSGTFAVARLPNVYSNIQTPSIVPVSGGGTALYTLPGGVSVSVGDVLRVEISSNANRWMWAEVTLTSSGGPGAWPILLVEEFFASGGLQTYRLAVQIGTSSEFNISSSNSITFRNGTINGSAQLLYVRGVQRRNY
jgi:hypothetical protein